MPRLSDESRFTLRFLIYRCAMGLRHERVQFASELVERDCVGSGFSHDRLNLSHGFRVEDLYDSRVADCHVQVVEFRVVEYDIRGPASLEGFEIPFDSRSIS